MKAILLGLTLALSLGACQTTRPPGEPGAPRMTEAEQIQLGCQGAQLTVVVLDGLDVELQRELNAVQLRAVSAAKLAVLRICAVPPQSLEELKTKGFAEAAATLTRELAAYLAARAAKP